jgi:hypothetical protein
MKRRVSAVVLYLKELIRPKIDGKWKCFALFHKKVLMDVVKDFCLPAFLRRSRAPVDLVAILSVMPVVKSRF